MMDRRLSNVQLQQRLYESETVYQQRYEDGSPRQSIVDQTTESPSTPPPGPPVPLPPSPHHHHHQHRHHHHQHYHHRHHHHHQQQQQQQQQQHARPSIVQQPKSARSSVGRSDSGSDRGNDRYTGYYLGYVGQAAHKRRRTTFWETLTGLVCSLGALASRAAKMATRRGEPL